MDQTRREELQELLNTIEFAIKELIERKVVSYRIGERSFTYYSISDLIAFRDKVLKELNETPITIIGSPFEELP